MDPGPERRLLQVAVAIACLVPIAAGSAGMLRGPDMIGGVHGATPTDLDSHFRYLSGLLLGIGIGFAGCIARIERKRALFGTLSGIVVAGGLARLVSLLAVGAPGAGHLFGLGMELGVVPLLLVWQRRVARLYEEPIASAVSGP
jgi:hypothetical protein